MDIADREYRRAQEQLFSDITAGRVQGTVVPCRADYVNAAHCLTIVAFPPEELSQTICRELVPHFAAVEPAHHYYPATTLHLTAKSVRAAAILPTFSEGDIVAVAEVLGRAARELSKLEFTLSGVARFPNSLAVRAFASPAFQSSMLRLDQALRQAGIADDKAYASDTVLFGNITFCRFTTTPSVQFDALVNQFEGFNLGRWCIDTLHLVSCDEVCSRESRRSHATVSLGEQAALRLPA